MVDPTKAVTLPPTSTGKTAKQSSGSSCDPSHELGSTFLSASAGLRIVISSYNLLSLLVPFRQLDHIFHPTVLFHLRIASRRRFRPSPSHVRLVFQDPYRRLIAPLFLCRPTSILHIDLASTLPTHFPGLFLYIYFVRQSFGPRRAACISIRPPDSPSPASHAAYSTAACASGRISPSSSQRTPAPQSHHPQLAAVPTPQRQTERELKKVSHSANLNRRGPHPSHAALSFEAVVVSL